MPDNKPIGVEPGQPSSESQGVITLKDVIDQIWVEGRRLFAAEFRSANLPGIALSSRYEEFLEKKTQEERRSYWLETLERTPSLLHAFKHDSSLIPRLEKRLVQKLTEASIQSDASIDDELYGRVVGRTIT